MNTNLKPHWKHCSHIFSILFLLNWGIPVCAQQRQCDVEAVCVSPEGTVVNGGSLPLRFEMWNRGPDLQFSYDTTLYVLFQVVEGDTQVLYQGMIRGRTDDTINVGGGSRYEDNYSIRFNFPDRTDTFTLDFCVRIASAGIYSNGDTLRLNYNDSNSSNNYCCKQVRVLPKTGTVISGKTQNSNGWALYPNPVNTTLFIQTREALYDSDVQVSVLDLAGRTIWIKNTGELDRDKGMLSVDVTSFPAGLYQLQLRSSKGLETKKFSVYK